MRQAIVTGAALAALALAPAGASAAPALDGTYTPSGRPTYITAGPDGNVWFSIAGSADNKELGRIAPDGTITEYDTPGDHPIFGITAGSDAAGGPSNRIWASYAGGVIEWDPAAASGTDHPIATLAGPKGIAADSDGYLWAVALDRLIKIKPDDGTFTDVQVGNISGRDIARGSDGRMWVADFGNSSITAVDRNPPFDRVAHDVGVGPQGIAQGPAGQLGFSIPNNEMGRITTGGAVTKTSDPGSDAFGTTYGADGAYWFAQFFSQSVGRLTPDGQYERAFTLPADSGPRHITAGPGNTLWVSTEVSEKIHRITGVEPPAPAPPPPPPGGDTTAPALSAVSVSVARRRLRLTLDEPATLRVQIDRKLKGRRKGKSCRPLKNGRRAKKKCSYWKKRRTIQRAGTTGRNTVSLGKRLPRGSYRLVVRATDQAGNTAKRTIRFKVKAKKKR